MSRGSGWKGSIGIHNKYLQPRESCVGVCVTGLDSHEHGIWSPPGEGGQEAWIKAERRARSGMVEVGTEHIKEMMGAVVQTFPGESYPARQVTGRKGAGEGRAPGLQLPGLHGPLCPSSWAGRALAPRVPLTLAGPWSHRLPEKRQREAVAFRGVRSRSGSLHRGGSPLSAVPHWRTGWMRTKQAGQGLRGSAGQEHLPPMEQSGTWARREAVLAAWALMTPGEGTSL